MRNRYHVQCHRSGSRSKQGCSRISSTEWLSWPQRAQPPSRVGAWQWVSLTPKTLSACRGQRYWQPHDVSAGKRAFLRRVDVARFPRGNGTDVPSAEGFVWHDERVSRREWHPLLCADALVTVFVRRSGYRLSAPPAPAAMTTYERSQRASGLRTPEKCVSGHGGCRPHDGSWLCLVAGCETVANPPDSPERPAPHFSEPDGALRTLVAANARRRHNRWWRGSGSAPSAWTIRRTAWRSRSAVDGRQSTAARWQL